MIDIDAKGVDSPGGVGVRYAGVTEADVRLRPAPRARKSFARAAYFEILARQLVSDGAVPPGAAQASRIRSPGTGDSR